MAEPDPDCPVCRAAVAMSFAFALDPAGECTHRMSSGVPFIPVYKVRDFVPVTIEALQGGPDCG